MEGMQKRHRQEQKDLHARVTQKKKSATKKSRKGVNDECAELERELRERQCLEMFELSGKHDLESDDNDSTSIDKPDESATQETPEDTGDSMRILPTTPVSNGQAKKPNRQKARLARRTAEQEAAAEQAQKEAADLPNLRDQERESMREAYTSRGLEEHEIRSDGHCLYAAVADQLQSLEAGLTPKLGLSLSIDADDKKPTTAGYTITRHVAAAYISQNPDDFMPFLEEPLDQYVRTIRETGQWGGHLEILALAKAYGVDINVLHGNGNVDKIECRKDNVSAQFWLAYYRHSFGLGEHYNSLCGTK